MIKVQTTNSKSSTHYCHAANWFRESKDCKIWDFAVIFFVVQTGLAFLARCTLYTQYHRYAQKLLWNVELTTQHYWSQLEVTSERRNWQTQEIATACTYDLDEIEVSAAMFWWILTSYCNTTRKINKRVREIQREKERERERERFNKMRVKHRNNNNHDDSRKKLNLIVHFDYPADKLRTTINKTEVTLPRNHSLTPIRPACNRIEKQIRHWCSDWSKPRKWTSNNNKYSDKFS